MNYKRIYNDFIYSRRKLEPKIIDSKIYCERHHIIPTSLGGDNSPQNIIVLTANEHLFAHLLLAKIHGGLMWLAVKAMLDFEPNRKIKKRRITNKKLRNKYNYVRVNVAKNYSERFSGQNSPRADKNIYILQNIDGRKAKGNRTELFTALELSRSDLSSLILGNSMSQKGWYYPEKNPEGKHGSIKGIDSPHADKTIYSFYHISGKTFKGTQIDFTKYSGIKTVSALIQGVKTSTRNGWGLSPDTCGNWINGATERAQNAADSRGDISGENNPRANKQLYCFINIKTNEQKSCKRAVMADFLQVNSARMHGMIEGHYKISDWCLKIHINKKSDIGGWECRGKPITIHKEDSTFTGTRKECAIFLQVAHQTISALVLGRYQTCKGWTLEEKSNKSITNKVSS